MEQLNKQVASLREVIDHGSVSLKESMNRGFYSLQETFDRGFERQEVQSKRHFEELVAKIDEMTLETTTVSSTIPRSVPVTSPGSVYWQRSCAVLPG